MRLLLKASLVSPSFLFRIEEDFVMTPEGARLLGRQKPRTASEVEALRA